MSDTDTKIPGEWVVLIKELKEQTIKRASEIIGENEAKPENFDELLVAEHSDGSGFGVFPNLIVYIDNNQVCVAQGETSDDSNRGKVKKLMERDISDPETIPQAEAAITKVLTECNDWAKDMLSGERSEIKMEIKT